AHLRARAPAAGFALEPLDRHEGPYYHAERWRLERRLTLCVYECKHHGWGDLSARTMRRAAERGAVEVIYLSKGATLESPAHVYEQVYCPSEWAVLRHARLLGRARSGPDLPNGLLQAHPELDTGLHASPPSVLEEDYALRDAVDAL